MCQVLISIDENVTLGVISNSEQVERGGGRRNRLLPIVYYDRM